MYKEILVPLDGSTLAETALPHATEIAKTFGGHITLLFVVEPIALYTQPGVIAPMISPPIDDTQDIDNAKKYLDQIVRRVTMDGADSAYVVREGDPASEICDYASTQKVDLIVMSTHGRTGLQRWVYGSVADRVLREASVPILLIRAHSK